MKWLELLKGLMNVVTWHLHLVLGSSMQNQVAFTTLPTLMSIMDTVRKLFNTPGDKEKN